VAELDLTRWNGVARATPTEYLGRACVYVESALDSTVVVQPGPDLVDGFVELDLAVRPERAFPGVAWRVQEDETYESFFVRPHQRGNPDAIQYTPVWHGLSSWQLYHGDGYWSPVDIPLEAWFRIRVAWADDRAVAEVAGTTVLAPRLVGPERPGRVGILVGGEGLFVSGFASGPDPGRVPAGRSAPAEDPDVLRAWEVSDPFAEASLPRGDVLDPAFLAARAWTPVEAAPGGLVDLGRVRALRDGRNTVLARTRIDADEPRREELELGFSDRAVVYLNGSQLFRGNDTYRSRDYRFLGSIGWYDAVHLPLEVGGNDLVVAVSEDFGGWGVQARLRRPPQVRELRSRE